MILCMSPFHLRLVQSVDLCRHKQKWASGIVVSMFAIHRSGRGSNPALGGEFHNDKHYTLGRQMGTS